MTTETKERSRSRLISRASLAERLDLHVSSIHRHVNSGLLPTPIKIGHRSLWKEDEVDAVIEKLAAERA